jgi:hypothetical protein
MPPSPSPDRAFFERLQFLAREHAAVFEKDGYCDSVVALRMLRDGAGAAPRTILLRFDDFLCSAVEELGDDEWTRRVQRGDVDFTLEGPEDVWREMLANIRANGGADARHTLNTLVLPGVPLRLVAPDPVNGDKFYRYNQSYQDFMNLAALAANEEEPR